MSLSSQAFREIVISVLVAIAILIVAGQRHPAHAVVIFNFTGTCDASATTCARENLELGGAVSGFMALDLGIYQFSSAPQSCGRGRQDRINLTMRRSPRVNQEVLPRVTFLG